MDDGKELHAIKPIKNFMISYKKIFTQNEMKQKKKKKKTKITIYLNALCTY